MLTVVQKFQIQCVGNCGVVERDLCEGRNGGLSCLGKAFEIDNFGLVKRDNFNTCKEDEISVEILIDFQFIKSYYYYEMLTKCFPATFCTI